MSDQIDTPPAPVDYNSRDVASRNSEMFKNIARDETIPDLPEGTDVGSLPVEKKETPKEPEKKESAFDIPEELLGGKPKAEVEDLLTAEPKGQLKNENYKKLQAHAREVRDAEKKRADELQKAFDEYKSKFKDGDLPEKYAKEREEYLSRIKSHEDLIGKKYVEESQAFKDRFTNRQNNLSAQLKKAGEELGFDSAAQLLGLPLKKRMEVLADSELSPAAVGHITSLLQQHDQIEAEKSAFLENWQTQKTELDRQEQAQADSQKAKMKEHLDRAFEKTLQDITSKFAPLKKIPGNDTWNAEIDQIVQRGREMMDGNFTDEQYSEIVLAGLGAIRQNAMYERAVQLLNETRTELASLKAANPDVNGQAAKNPTNNNANNDRFDRNDSRRAFREIAGATRLNEVA